MNRQCKEYVNNFRDKTLPHFVRGLTALLPFAKSVAIFGEKDLEESECDKVKREVELIHREMDQATKEAEALITSMHKDYENLAKDIDEAYASKKSLEESLQDSKNELVKLENQRYNLSDKLQTSRNWLQQLESTLSAAETRLAEKTTGRDMGIGLLLIAPCVGIPMIVDYNKELNNAKNLLKTTDNKKHHLSEAISKNEEEIKSLNIKIPEKNDEIEKLKDNLARQVRKVEDLEMAFKALTDTKDDLKHCFNYLTSVLETVKMLNSSCNDLYSLEPLMTVITETFNIIKKQNSRNELLTNNPCVKELVKSLWMQQFQVVPCEAPAVPRPLHQSMGVE
ncbi:uncharacterized protein [Narcine bancroftii]|uniref:uncharacterized protein n=1 Tax=Narcine bancroftii TaxID=1343680 RepID=UPI003831485C